MPKNSKKRISWVPERPTSKGASAYHNAVVNTSWHKENINELIAIFAKKVKKGDSIIDFGAGTGASAVYFLKKLKKPYFLLLVDNSPSWLGKAYEVLHTNKNTSFHLLQKNANGYQGLDGVVGKSVAQLVVSANTVHLIPDINKAFKGIYKSLSKNGLFTFQSGNIARTGRKKGLMMIDDSVKEVHDIAIYIIQTDNRFKKFRKNLRENVLSTVHQRKLVFPDPRPTEFYLRHLKSAGFKKPRVRYVRIRVSYKDWLNFLRVRRLQAGILPEIGGKDASPQLEKLRDQLITLAAKKLFSHLKKENPFANNTSFIAEWTYVIARK